MCSRLDVLNVRTPYGIRIALLSSLTLALLAAATALAAPPFAGPPELKVEVVPASVEIPAQGQVEALVVVRNPLTDTLRDVRLAWFTDVDVSVIAEPASPQVLVPYGALAWTVRVAQKGQETVPGVVHLRVDYTWRGDQGETPAVAIGSLAVTARSPEAVDQVAQVRVETALTSLMEHRPGVVYLIITNTSDVPVQVVHILANGPKTAGGQEFVKFTLPASPTEASLAPRETRAFPVTVEATEAVQPGKHLLLFEVGLKWQKAGSQWNGSVVATHPVEVGIVGESEFLTALGVPSFLVLPGFLFMVALGLLWRFVAPRSEFPLTIKTQEFWFVAITFSLGAAFLYPVVTGWAGDARNYLEGYGLNDVVRVWIGSIACAVIVYGIVGGGSLGRRLLAGWWVRRRTPSTGDRPLAILYKLHRQGLGIQLPRVNVTVEGETQPAYCLEPWRAGAEKVWVGPPITLKWRVDKIVKDEDKNLQQQIVKYLEPGARVLELAEFVEKGRARGILDMNWGRIGQLRGPYQAKVAEGEQGSGLEPNSIIEQE